MSYSTVIVHLDLGSTAERRVKLAGSLADRFDARLIGVAAQPCYLPVSGIATACAPGLVENEQDRIRDELAQAEAVFRRGAGARNSIEWRSAISMPGPFIAEQARAADLIVVSQKVQSDDSAWRFGVSPEELVLTVGRPVLIASPYDSDFSAQRVIVAWKDTREARRAVSDALPVLKAAEEVFVVAIGDETRRAGLEDVAAYLRRHGIESTTVLRRDAPAGVADEIMKMAEQEQADLIISGAYGYSRMREWMFGGVTRELLKGAPVCCLMSH
jgi:nucleotide-binding universal stress UspA family protein